jgi:hypothetical protein
MNRLLRPYKFAGIVLLAGAGAALLLAPPRTAAQTAQLVQFIEEPGQEPSMLLLHSTQGYLGVELADVDNEKAQALKLKEVRGAVITLIDHDAPAGQIKLQVNDVVLQLNGQPVEGAEQLRRMLREIPAGRKITLQYSRDGNVQTVTVELADRKIIEQNAWKRFNDDGMTSGSGPGMGILTGEGDVPPSGGSFHWWLMGSSLNVGAMVEPLTAQMADYLDLPNGLMVKSVAHKSAAAAAGLKAHDVILKVDAEPIATIADWERALHSNQGKPVQVTVLRDRKQQTFTLQVDSKHHQGELEQEEFFSSSDSPLVAELGQEISADALAQAERLHQQAEAMRDQMLNQAGEMKFQITPEQAEQMRQMAEKLRESIKPEELQLKDFKLDPKAMDELRQQMAEMRKQMPERFKLDSKQTAEMLQDMKQFQILAPSYDEQLRRQLDQLQRQELDQLKRQMEEMQALGFGDHI